MIHPTFKSVWVIITMPRSYELHQIGSNGDVLDMEHGTNTNNRAYDNAGYTSDSVDEKVN